MAKTLAIPGWQRAVIVLAGTVVGVVVISCLYWAQTVLIPIALAVFLTFLLAPLVNILQRRGLKRVFAVVVVVLTAALLLGGTVWLVADEVASFVGELPTYSENIQKKLTSLRRMGQGTERLEQMFQDLTKTWKLQPAHSEADGTNKSPAPIDAAPERPSTMVLQPESTPWLSRLPALISPVVELLGGLALALVLAVFMLLKREALRNRLIRLVGDGRLTVTTKAVEDAGQRISRFLLMQLIINGSYGLALALGLFLLQVPHAFLWGFLATLLRYVPYLGTAILSGLLVTLSLAISPGWVQPFLVLGLIAALELIAYYVLEPWLFSHSIGVSEVALLVATAFWAFLWGPVGLVLASPLTVCLVVLGKYVPQMEFLEILLGDESTLEADVSFYQRLLARDQDEAEQLVLAHAKIAPPKEIYDKVLIPALNYAKRDRERDDVTEADEQFILQAIQEIIEDVGDSQAVPVSKQTVARTINKVRLLGCPGSGRADALALEMLRQLLDPARWDVEVLSLDMLSAELVALVAAKEPAVVCIGALPPGGLAHTRYLCKRLRARLPEARIIVGRWGLKGNVEQNEQQLREAGADVVETTLLETQVHLSAWLPVLAHEGAKTTVNGAPADRRKVTV